MKRIGFIFIPLFLMSCGDDSTVATTEASKLQDPRIAEIVEHDKPLSAEEFATTLKLLEEIAICGNADNSGASSCDTSNFKIFPIGKKPMTQAFAVQIKKNVQLAGEPVATKDPRIQIYEREKGKLVLINEFRHAVLVSQIPHNNANNDLEIVIYHDHDNIDYYTRFNFENGKYRFREIIRFDEEPANPGNKMRFFPENIKDSANNLMYTEFVESGWIH